jgi:hypothetical protein
MAYWWVSQNQTYRHERTGGFLWAPNQTDAGLIPFHWATMNEVRPGDIIFSYGGGRIVAVAVANPAAPAREILARGEDFEPLPKPGPTTPGRGEERAAGVALLRTG